MKYILISHGTLSSGLKKSLEIILGVQNNLYAIDMYLDDISLEEKFFKICEENSISLKEVIIFTDIFGGSVNQKIMQIVNLEETRIVTGMNLPLLLEVIMNGKEIDNTKLKHIIKDSTSQMLLVNDFNFDYNDDF